MFQSICNRLQSLVYAQIQEPFYVKEPFFSFITFKQENQMVLVRSLEKGLSLDNVTHDRQLRLLTRFLNISLNEVTTGVGSILTP